MQVPDFLQNYTTSFPPELLGALTSTYNRINPKGGGSSSWQRGVVYIRGDIIEYKGDYFQSTIGGNLATPPDKSNSAFMLNWDQVNTKAVPLGYARDDSVDNYWTGALVTRIAGEGTFPLIYGGYTYSSDPRGPDAFHQYNRKEGKLQNFYQSPHMAIASKGGAGEAVTFKYSYALPIYELCHGTRPIENQGISGNWNFYNAFYAPGYYQPPYGENPTLTIIGSDEGLDGQMQEIAMLAGELPGGYGACCKKMTIAEKRAYWGIRTTFPTTGPLVSTDTKKGEVHPIHAPSEECPPEFPPSVYFVETTYGWHPGSMYARLAGNFYNDNPFPSAADIDGHAEAHVYKTQTCYTGGGGLYQGWFLDSQGTFTLQGGNNPYPRLTYPTAGATENKLKTPICNARALETNTAASDCSSCTNIQLGASTGPGGAVNDQANFFGYNDSVYWHFIFRYNHEEFFNQTENTSTNLVTSFLGTEGKGATTATEDHYWTYRQCPNTIDYLPWSSATPIHACPNEYFDVPYYAAIGKFGFYGARFLNKCGRTGADLSGATDDGIDDIAYHFYNYRRLDEYKNFPPNNAVNGGNWIARNAAGILRVEKQFDSGPLFEARNKAGNQRLKYKIVKIDEECYVLTPDSDPQIEHGPLDGGWKIEIGSTAGGSNVASTCEGDGSLSQADCHSYCNPEFDDTAHCSDPQFDLVHGPDKQNCQANGATWIEGNKIGSLHWCVGDGGSRCHLNNMVGGITYFWCLRRGGSWVVGQWEKRNWLLSCDSQQNQHSSPNPGVPAAGVAPVAGDIPRDWPLNVSDCACCDGAGNQISPGNVNNSTAAYIEPPVLGASCSEADYRSLLQVAKSEQRAGDWFAGNVGFFLWANWPMVVASLEWKKSLIGDGSEGFKRALSRLKDDFDAHLGGTKEHFLKSVEVGTCWSIASNDLLPEYTDEKTCKANLGKWKNNDLILFTGGGGPAELFKSGPLTYSIETDRSDILFTNERFERFLRELQDDRRNNVFCNGLKAITAWNDILKYFGSYVADVRGKVDEDFYRRLIESRERRLLTRYVENHNRGMATDLFPLSQITFAVDHMSGYLNDNHWGRAIYGDTVDSVRPFENMPEVERRYFQGVYASKDSVSGLQDVVQGHAKGTHYFYAGMYNNVNCGGDLPRKLYNIGASIVGNIKNAAIKRSPWRLQGLGGIGRLDPNFSCFTPIFTQQPLDVVCKLGQAPTFRCAVVDYHTIPEDKVGKGYPEIDFWVNNLKLADSGGESLYPLNMQWYRIHRSKLDINDPAVTNVSSPVDDALGGNKAMRSVLEYAEPASLRGNWACIEGRGGRGTEDCTLFHPYESVAETHVDKYQGNETLFLKNAGNPQICQWPKTPHENQGDMVIAGTIAQHDAEWPPEGYCNYSPQEEGLQGTFTHCANNATPCAGGNPDVTTLWVSGGMNMQETHRGAKNQTESYALTKGNVVNGNTTYTVGYGTFGHELDCESSLYQDPKNGGWFESVTCNALTPSSDIDSYTVKTGRNSSTMVFQKGAKGGTADSDEEYYYFALASGRFGMRRSEYASLETENWVRMDVSVRNGSPSQGTLGLGVSVNSCWGKGSFTSIPFKPGLFGAGKTLKWQGDGTANSNTVMPFAGITRDPNAAWENTWRTYMNLSNNCESFAPVGMENFRGTTRTYQPPVQTDIRGTRADSSSYFEYGLLYPFGLTLGGLKTVTQTVGDLLYGHQHLPKCKNYEMLDGHKGPRLNLTYQGATIRHFSVLDPAVLCEHNPPGLKPRQLFHHGEFYPWPEGDSYRDYAEKMIGYWAMGTAWQFSNLLGKIPRFGKEGHHQTKGLGIGKKLKYESADTDDVVYWGGVRSGTRERNYKDAQRLIGGTTLAGSNCGWCGFGERLQGAGLSASAGRFMLYFVENHQRVWLSCNQKGTKRTANHSYIAPGIRRGSSAIQFFWGGKPYNTYLKRTPMYGPYAFEWKTMNHNRDRNGNGLCEAFYSTGHNRQIHLYDPPAIYGLYLSQQGKRVDQKVKFMKKKRRIAFGAGANVKGLRFGRHGMKTGCGTVRLRCVDDRREPRNSPLVSHPLSHWDTKCHYYHYGKNLGIDPGRNYGCNNVQLLAGVCFDPCLSMKYNYGFFPGGKLLALSNYVKFTKTLVKAAKPTIGADKYIVQISANHRDTDIDLSYTSFGGGAGGVGPKPVRGGFRRIMRGPWGTPYKLIRESILAREKGGAGVGNLTKYKKYDHGYRVVIGNDTVMPAFYSDADYSIEKNSPLHINKKYEEYIGTEISPCTSRGSDHCNYLTATCHLGMDSVVVDKQDLFTDWGTRLAGKFEDSKEFTTAQENAALIMRGFEEAGRAGMMAATIGGGIAALICFPVAVGWSIAIVVGGVVVRRLLVDGPTANATAWQVVEAMLGGQGLNNRAEVKACVNKCWSETKPPAPDSGGGYQTLSEREVAKRSQETTRIMMECGINCTIADAYEVAGGHPLGPLGPLDD